MLSVSDFRNGILIIPEPGMVGMGLDILRGIAQGKQGRNRQILRQAQRFGNLVRVEPAHPAGAPKAADWAKTKQLSGPGASATKRHDPM